jgi:hypothetical protein
MAKQDWLFMKNIFNFMMNYNLKFLKFKYYASKELYYIIMFIFLLKTSPKYVIPKSFQVLLRFLELKKLITFFLTCFLHSYDILGAGMLWKPKEARILTNFIDQPVNIGKHSCTKNVLTRCFTKNFQVQNEECHYYGFLCYFLFIKLISNLSIYFYNIL